MPFPAQHTFHADDADRYHLSASLPATSCSRLLKADAPHAPEHILWSAASSCSQGPGIPNTRILRSLHIPSEYTKSDPASNAVRLFYIMNAFLVLAVKSRLITGIYLKRLFL